ncbi:MAG: CRTAC1 family protein [Acidobacteria bacterium]|nr:CRTAC1 family protein [Acidobacteriota bacterium]
MRRDAGNTSKWFLLAALLIAPLLLRPADSPSSSPGFFADVTRRAGIRFLHQASPTSRKYLIESMSGGVAVFDYDGDGRPDIFFVNGAALQDPMPPGAQPDKTAPRFWNRLYRNNGDGTFTDVTERAGLQGRGYGMGVAAADFDNDGHTDLYVTNLDGNILYRNNGDGTFTDVTAQAGVGGSGWSAGALFIDYDRDGLLDLVVSRYLKWDFSRDIWCGEHKPGYRAYCHPDQFEPFTHLVFHNLGHGRFEDVSARSGFTRYPGKGLGVAMSDFDRDGWPDVFIANDAVPQQLFRNRGDGTFEEVALLRGAAYDSDGRSFSGMGTDFGDYDNDGWPDLFANALATQRYALFHNLKGTFDYASDSTGVGSASMLHSGWGSKFVDFDNDGWPDLFVAQGHVMDNIQLTEPHLRYLETPLLLRNVNGRFVDVSAQAGPPFRVPRAARGAAAGDLNGDGRVDLVVNCNNGPAVILENRASSANHWLIVDTQGSRSNRDGIGTGIRLVTASGLEQYAMVTTAGSYLSSNDKRVHFGLGRERTVKLLELTWPSGRVQRLENLAVDRILTVREP